MRARAVIGSLLVVLSALLAACGEEQDAAEAGDIVKARADDQFSDGREAAVMLPTGRLLIHAAEPVDTATADETRTRQPVDAPAGAVLVPISWQYDPWDKGRLDAIVATAENPVVDLVADQEHYRLPPPQLDDLSGESFYVVVDGDAEKRFLEIEFDGVTQKVDLARGRTKRGAAAALYDVEDGALKKTPCVDQGGWFAGTGIVADFACDMYGPVLTPYASGEWAPKGSLWLAVTVQTEMRVYGEGNGLGGGARFNATAVEVKPEIDGVAPVREVSTDDDADACPIPLTTVCGWSKILIFEVPADDGEQGPLTMDVSYRMRLSAAYGGYLAPKQKKVETSEELTLWGD